MKKIAGFVLSLIFVLLFGFSASATGCEVYSGGNENAQNYSVWASTVKSYAHVCNDGRLMRVQYIISDNKLLIEYYDSSFNLISQKILSTDFSVFGGFYAVGDNYFVLTGQNNPYESSSVTCFAVTKYDKSWKKIATAELKDCNTTVPFDAGSARFAHSGKYLLIRTSHEMYRHSDGLNHQANVTIQLDMDSMKITDYFTDVMNLNYGYVSHSFNQFIKVDSDKIIALDHGDAHPRSIVLIKYKTSVSSGRFVPSYAQNCTAVDMLSISGQEGANQTNCSVGGFEITASGYLAALNSINQSSSSVVRNIYLAYCGKSSERPELKQLTYYTESGVSTPHLIKIDEKRLMVFWSFKGKVFYCEVDDKGNVNGNIMSFEGALSDCQPVIYSNRIVWFVWENSRLDFYSISLSDLTDKSVSTITSGHSYSPVNVNGTAVNLRCSKCGGTASGKVPSDFSLWWEDLSYSYGSYIFYSSAMKASYHPGDNVRLMVKYTSADLNDYEVTSDDESVAAVRYKDGEYSVTAMKVGTAKITVSSAYNPDIKAVYIFNVSHSWTEKESYDATCDKDGKRVKVCDVCGESTTEVVPAKGHNMGAYKVAVEATCKTVGKKEALCSRCGYSDTVEMPKKQHNKNTAIEAVAATCTRQGKTEGKKCSVCGTVTEEQQTVEALGHSLGEYKVTKKATCTAKGEETAECIRCSYTKTRDTERISHKEVTVKAVEPTCTKSGKTAGKKCSVCDKITVAQETVEALGHSLGDYEVTKKATCTAKGEETAECIRCSYTKTRDTERISHKEVTVKAVEPTCTKSGKTAGKKCSDCDKVTVEQQTVEALGHSLGEYKVTKKATCTAKGEETAECIRCSYTKTRDTERISHKEVTVKAVEPTCTKSGKTAGKKCSVCDKVTVEQQTVEALGHSLGEYEITKEATCTAKGEKTGVCIRCSYAVVQDIEKTPHREVALEAVAPVCTRSGKTEGKKCSVCDKIIVAQKSVDALGHSKKETVLATATTQANGKISTACEICGENFGEQRVYRISSITLSSTRCTYNGKTKTPSVRVVDYNKDTLVKDKDYTVTYEKSRKNIGKYSVEINFIGKYSGSTTLYYEILPGATSKITTTQSTSVVKLKWNAVKGANGYRVYQYDSKTAEYKQIASVKNITEYRVTKLKTGKDYKFAVKAYYKSADGEVYFSNSMKTVSTATEPAKAVVSLNPQSKSAVISWNKCSGADGYQIYYSNSKDGKYKKLKSTSSLSYKKTGLTSGKKYYFKVRAYKKTASGTVYGEFSKVQSVKIK